MTCPSTSRASGAVRETRPSVGANTTDGPTGAHALPLPHARARRSHPRGRAAARAVAAGDGDAEEYRHPYGVARLDTPFAVIKSITSYQKLYSLQAWDSDGLTSDLFYDLTYSPLTFGGTNYDHTPFFQMAYGTTFNIRFGNGFNF